MRVGFEWPAWALYGHFAYASAWGFIGGYNGTQLVTLGPDVSGMLWKRPDGRVGIYAIGGANAGLAVVSQNDTRGAFAFGFLAAVGVRDLETTLKPALEMGTRTEIILDQGDAIGTSSIYLAFNCTFGGDKADGPAPKQEEAPPCPTDRAKAERAEDELRRLKKEEGALDEKAKETGKALGDWREQHANQTWNDKLEAEEKPLLDAASKAQTALDDNRRAQKKEEGTIKTARETCDPVLKQETITSCGPTAIRMIVKSYGKAEPTMKDVCNAVPGTFTTEKGTEVKDTDKILKHYGIDAKVEPHSTIDALEKATNGGKPAITVVKAGTDQHAVVVDRVIDNQNGTKDVTGRDPLTGDRFTMPASEFDKWWTEPKVMISTSK